MRQTIPCKQVKHLVADHWILSLLSSRSHFCGATLNLKKETKQVSYSYFMLIIVFIRHRTLTDNCQVFLSHSQICVQSIETR